MRVPCRSDFERLLKTFKVVEYEYNPADPIYTPRKAKYTIATTDFVMEWGDSLLRLLGLNPEDFPMGEFGRRLE